MRYLPLTYLAGVAVGLTFVFSALPFMRRCTLKTFTPSTGRRDRTLPVNSGLAGWVSIARPSFSSVGRKRTENGENHRSVNAG